MSWQAVGDIINQRLLDEGTRHRVAYREWAWTWYKIGLNGEVVHCTGWGWLESKNENHMNGCLLSLQKHDLTVNFNIANGPNRSSAVSKIPTLSEDSLATTAFTAAGAKLIRTVQRWSNTSYIWHHLATFVGMFTHSIYLNLGCSWRLRYFACDVHLLNLGWTLRYSGEESPLLGWG